MEKELWKGLAVNLGHAAVGFVCSLPCLLGCYPVVPAAAAVGLLRKKRSVFLYIGLLAGMVFFMDYRAVTKYAMLVAVVCVAVFFYKWANRQCSGMAAGLIAGAATVAMNLSGTTLSAGEGTALLIGVSEGLVVVGLTGLIHYGLEMAGSGFIRLGWPVGSPGKNPPSTTWQEGKVEALMSAVDGLSEVFSAMSTPQMSGRGEEADMLSRQLEGALCASCDGCAVCWPRHHNSPSESISRMLDAVMAHRSREEIISEAYVEDCVRYPDLVEEAMRAFGKLELNRAWYRRLMENRQMIAGQLDAMAGLLASWTKGEKLLDDRSRLLLARIAFETKERGLLVQDLHIYENAQGRRCIRGMVASKWDGGIPSRKYLEALEKASHSSLRLERSLRAVLTQDWVWVTAYENTNYYTLPGIAMRKKDSSSISGDNFTMFELDEGYYMVGLSDGMGSGRRANQESGLVVDLTERLLKAGFPTNIAIQMMNSAMVLQGERGSYSTLDLARLDLYTGELSLTKIGGAASFLRRGERIRCLEGRSLPAGASPEQKAAEIKISAGHGDFLVMVTDGVLEYLQVDNPKEYFAELIKSIVTDNAGILAKALLDKVLEKTGGCARDDMTIVVTGIWEKK